MDICRNKKQALIIKKKALGADGRLTTHEHQLNMPPISKNISPKPFGSRKSNRGLTLVETIVSIVILIVMLAGGVQLYFVADKLTGLTIRKKLALEIINTKMENIKNTSFDTVQTTSGVLINIGSLKGTLDEIVKDFDSAGNNPPQAPNPVAYKEITITFAWNEAGENDPHIYNIVTYIAP